MKPGREKQNGSTLADMKRKPPKWYAGRKRRRQGASCPAAPPRTRNGEKKCSIDCRQRLRYHLNIRIGLLQARNNRHDKFYFTEQLLVLDVLPYSSDQIFSYLYPRSLRSRPVDDFCDMANHQGNAWWDEVIRTRKRYLASQYRLERAHRNHKRSDAIRPMEIKIPSRVGSWIIQLKLSRSRLVKGREKSLGGQTMKHQPDLGGNQEAFRKIHEAYVQLNN